MRPVYATCLQVHPKSHQNPTDVYEDLTKMAHRWMVREIGPKLEHDPVWTQYMLRKAADNFYEEDARGACRVEVRNIHAGEERAWRGAMVYPFHEAFHIRRDLQLRSEVQVRLTGRRCMVTIRRLIGATTEVVRPDRYEAGTPALVNEIIEAYKTRCGNVEIRRGAWRINDQRVQSLIEMIAGHERRMPVVVISRTPDGDTLVDPDLMSEALAGLAQVAVLRTVGTAAHFSRAMELTLPVTDGSVRVFWPGFSQRDQPADHLFYPAADLAQAEGGDALPRTLRHMLCELACWTYRADPRIREMEREAAEAETAQRGQAITEFLARFRSGDAITPDTSLEDVLTRIGVLIDEARVAVEQEREVAARLFAEAAASERRAGADYHIYQSLNDLQSQEIAELREERLEVAQEVERLRAQLAAASPLTPSAVGSALDQLFYARHLKDIVPVVEASADPAAILFLPAAHRSAGKSRFHGDLRRASELLRSVCRVAVRYHEGDIVDAGFMAAFAKEGEPDFASGSSTTTLTQHEGDYTVRYNDGSGKRPVLLGPHVGIGSGKQGSSVKVYWYVDQANRRFVVGHIGRHLPIATF